MLSILVSPNPDQEHGVVNVQVDQFGAVVRVFLQVLQSRERGVPQTRLCVRVCMRELALPRAWEHTLTLPFFL